ncbi:DAO-domain-containing protein [Basidiobolus meristosporus CBS 931.73]|uniref:Glycerol-3-phosphate dehydrogenase n=1 Tax=Basidiobolus meristosporus CBS 931.73 TaxID=1314790 RepID=A0A1Y1Y4C6_9FUNG|nr:DAO-domain-containing protein [Basidiobolus meristosporus CBS 931.73]|eukprot:ORX92870.1 DAO-domain-containing protein [Basidiobolus meristosporus CBS 931.73]
MWTQLKSRPYLYSSLVATSAVTSYYYFDQRRGRAPLLSRTHAEAQSPATIAVDPNRPNTFWSPPSRQQVINQLKGLQQDGSERPKMVQNEVPFDLLIVGGGATGAGIALDAATRGLKVAMVERDDFASGTSSRSTKLVHGGVRYLEKAFMELDYEQYKLVTEALHERATFLKIAPYLSYQLPIMLPVYKWWQLPYYWVGCKFYDLFAGKEKLESSYVLSKSKALEAFPMLKEENLVGALVYYDGQHNDSRMNVAIALTAVTHGAVVANHVEVMSLYKEPSIANNNKEVVTGAKVRDTLTGEEWTIHAKGVINATGPFTDGLRQMDEPQQAEIVAPSAGVHIILPNYYSPQNMGLLDPATTDGRGNVIAGTTDSKTEVTANPLAQEEEIAWILDEVKRYLSPDVEVRRSDVLAAWSGIRPLVRDPSSKNTASLVRNHMINVSGSNLITIAGGKWTTYRAMAEETVDRAIKVFDLQPTNSCCTESTKLIGSHLYTNTMFIKLIQHFGLETEVARHLASSYGDRAWGVAALAESTNKVYPKVGTRLSNLYPYIEAEVRYAVRNEYACTAIDVLARRTRLAFLNAHAAMEALPKVIEIMSEELNWDKARKQKEYAEALEFLKTMGLSAEYTRKIPTERSGGGV